MSPTTLTPNQISVAPCIPVNGYRAANWQLVGQSTGRSRNDRYHRLSVPAKDHYLYPLTRDFRRRLCDDT